MSVSQIRMKIADIIIEMKSDFPHMLVHGSSRGGVFSERYKCFLYHGKRKPDISIDVEVVPKLPPVRAKKMLFQTNHFETGEENWTLFKNVKEYVYSCPIERKEQIAYMNNAGDHARVFLLPQKAKTDASKKTRALINEHKGCFWDFTDIIYDFLQVMLISYCSLRSIALFAHAVGVKDIDGRGFLFAGKSGAGKSTTARIWHKHSRATVLNDDRVIIREKNGKFILCGSPWHGEFSDYLVSRFETVVFDKAFFIYHARDNKVRAMAGRDVFAHLFPSIFPPFWSREGMQNTISFCQSIMDAIPCYRLGFTKSKQLLPFIRSVD